MIYHKLDPKPSKPNTRQKTLWKCNVCVNFFVPSTNECDCDNTIVASVPCLYVG